MSIQNSLFPSEYLLKSQYNSAENHKNNQPQKAAKELFACIQKEDLSMIKKIVSNHPDSLEETKGYFSNTPLLEAASSGKLRAVKVLVNAGANIFATNSSNDNVLTLLLNQSNLPTKDVLNLIEMLCKRGLEIDMLGSNGSTPLMKACSGKNLQLIKGLVKLGADIEARDKKGETVLMKAVSADNLSAVDFLVSKRVNLDAVDILNHNAFVHSILSGALSSFSYFVKKINVDINQQDWCGATPLMWAGLYSRSEMVRILLKKGADLSLKTSKPIRIEIVPPHPFLNFSLYKKIKTIPVGSTAKMIAKQFDCAETFRLIEKAENHK